MNKLFLVLGFFLVSSSCIAGTEIRTLPAWPDRPYLIYTPNSVPTRPQASRPVVFSLHGAGSNGEEQQINTCADGVATSDSCLDRLADKENFIVIYPNGEKVGTGCRLPDRECFPRHWSPAGSCGLAKKADAEQVQGSDSDNDYLAAVLADVERENMVDTRAVYFSGMSNGASMAFDISCQLKDKVAAVALIAGTGDISESCSCAHGKHPSMLQFHGTTDPIWSYGSGKDFVQDAARAGACEGTDVASEFPNADTQDGTSVVQHAYQNCQGGDLVHYEIIGGGHTWPGGFLYSPRVGRVTRDISGNEVMWDFFQSHKK
jgi:polyhydroxybutyrate depolymerase